MKQKKGKIIISSPQQTINLSFLVLHKERYKRKLQQLSTQLIKTNIGLCQPALSTEASLTAEF